MDDGQPEVEVDAGERAADEEGQKGIYRGDGQLPQPAPPVNIDPDDPQIQDLRDG